jgi:hypothetical protein
MSELIKTEIKLLKGKKVILFFKYAHLQYNIRKSGIILDCDDKFFIVQEVKDGRTTFSYDFIVEVMEDKS